jgi:hypothetical protein
VRNLAFPMEGRKTPIKSQKEKTRIQEKEFILIFVRRGYIPLLFNAMIVGKGQINLS